MTPADRLKRMLARRMDLRLFRAECRQQEPTEDGPIFTAIQAVMLGSLVAVIGLSALTTIASGPPGYQL